MHPSMSPGLHILSFFIYLFWPLPLFLSKSCFLFARGTFFYTGFIDFFFSIFWLCYIFLYCCYFCLFEFGENVIAVFEVSLSFREKPELQSEGGSSSDASGTVSGRSTLAAPETRM